MTYEPESMRLANEHASDLLPEYIAGALHDETRQAVRTHLLTCASCAAELRAWKQIGAVEVEHVAETPTPSLALLGEVWRRIDAAPAAQPAEPRSAPAAYLWNMVTAQARLLRRSVWIASALGIALAT